MSTPRSTGVPSNPKSSKPQKTGAVLVLGGGIAGIQAALDLAESGYKVYLVEKSPAIGGRMPQLDKTFPTKSRSSRMRMFWISRESQGNSR
jgi:heterodisulfide reductase subunit A-like polyferredoxin